MIFFHVVVVAVVVVHGYNTPLGVSKNVISEYHNERRSFLISIAATTTTFLLSPPLANAAIDIKVSNVAHTFITSSNKPKPLRENDATRYLTNAKVVYLFKGNNNDETNLFNEIVQLTIDRKAGQGPGVTPGNVHVLTTSATSKEAAAVTTIVKDSITTQTVVEAVASSSLDTDGDILLVGPLPSKSTVRNGKMVAEAAQALGIKVGGAREGGLVSVLMDGPTQGLLMEEEGYPTSTILWYST